METWGDWLHAAGAAGIEQATHGNLIGFIEFTFLHCDNSPCFALGVIQVSWGLAWVMDKSGHESRACGPGGKG